MKTFQMMTVLLLGALLSVSACTKKDGAGSSAEKSSPELRIGFVLATTQEERYAKDQKYFQDKVTSLGGKVLFASANNNEQEQLAKVENLLSQGIKALVVQPVNSRAASNFVRLAHQDGVPVIAYDRVILNAPVDLYVTQDSYRVGVLQAEAALKYLGNKGNVVILRGESGHSVANEITRGVLDTLARFPKVQVVVNQAHAGWSADLAMKTVENALTANKNNIQAVLANNSGMANGAVQALQEQKLVGKVFVAGADADLTSIKNVVAGRQQFEVLKAIAPLAEAAAVAAVQLAKKEPVRHDLVVELEGYRVPVVNTPVFAITKDNVEQEIIATGFHTREAVFGTTSN